MQKKRKIHNFSNPYSRHNQSVMGPTPHKLQTGRTAAGKSPNSVSAPRVSPRPARSVSPGVVAQASISHFPDLQKYRQLGKLCLGKERMDKIKYILEIEDKSKEMYQQRKKADDLYFKYPKTNKRDPQREEGSIFKALDELRNDKARSELDIRNYRPKLQNPQEYEQRSKKQMGLKQIHKVKEENNYDQLDISTVLSTLPCSPFEELDNIVGTSEDNFFKRELDQKELNIFQFLKQSEQPQFDSGWQSLKRHHFCFASVSTVYNKRISEDLHRNLSTFSRISTICSDSDSIPKEFKISKADLVMEPEEISLDNLFLMAKGLVTPAELLREEIKEKGVDLQKKDSSLAEISNLIHYKDGHRSKNTIFCDLGADKSDLSYYRKVPLTDKERDKMRLSKECLAKLEKLLGLQGEGKKQRIEDRGTRLKLQKQVEQALMGQLKSIGDENSLYSKDVEKRIRFNKNHKDKCQNIQIGGTVCSLRQKKIAEGKFKPKQSQNVRV